MSRVCWTSCIVVICLDTRDWPLKSVLSFEELHLSIECWRTFRSNNFTRETRDKSHQGGGGGCRLVGVSRKAYCNSKPIHSLLDRASGLSARLKKPHPEIFLIRSVGVWGQYRTMYGECISCTLHPALYEGLARWDLMLTDNLFIASHEPWHNSGLGSIHHFQAQPGSLPQARASTPRRRTKAGDGACEQIWFNCTGYTKGRTKSTCAS